MEHCKKFRVKKPAYGGRYEAGQGRCQTCDIWLDHRGCHLKDGEGATQDSLAWFCNCCNMRVRRNPRNIKYKTKLRASNTSTNASDLSTVDVSYFSRFHARLLKNLSRILIKSNSLDDQKTENKLDKMSRDVELEFGVNIGKMCELAQADVPNKASLIMEIERIRHKIGEVPTKENMQKYSKFKISQYEVEFESWEHLLEKLGYDPFYRNNTKNIAIDHKQKSTKADTIISDMAYLNQLITNGLALIKANKQGQYLDDLRTSLKISQKEMSAVATRLLRIDGVYQKEIWHNGVLQDVLLKYTDMENKIPETIIPPKLPPKNHDDVAYSVESNDIVYLSRQILDEYSKNNKAIDHTLQQDLTKEFFDVRSLKEIIKNHPELSEKTIRMHVRTPLRLPPRLKELNEEGLHPEPSLSSHIALFAADYYNWDGEKDSEDKVTDMALSLAKQVIALQRSDYVSSDEPNMLKDKIKGETISIALSVWIAAATLHKKHGMNAMFTTGMIREQVYQQKLCHPTEATLLDIIRIRCLANVRASRPSEHRKLYRVDSKYRLYKRGDPYHPSRQNCRIAPLPVELPDEYKDLRRWYDEEYCKQ